MADQLNRREFVKRTVATTAALSVAGTGLPLAAEKYLDSKGLPTAMLGQNGATVPRMVIGCGSRWLAVEDEDKALEIIEYALNHGLYHLDTASSYKNKSYFSEERLGKILPSVRKQVFLSTKVHDRNPDKAKVLIETSLKRLNTDYIDLLQIHNIQSVEDVEEIRKPGGLLEVVQQAKEEKIARFIGFTGHTSAEAMTEAAKTFAADTMLIALNHYQNGNEAFEQGAIPAAQENGLGVLGMKVVRPRENNKTLSAPDLIKYALSLNQVDAVVIGTDSLEVLKENINLLKSFEPLPEERMQEIRMSLQPYYLHKNLEWMHPSYTDGEWA